MPRIFKIFMGGSECVDYGSVSSAIGYWKMGSRAEAGHQGLKLVAAVGVAAKHVETGKRGAEHDLLAGPGGGRRAAHRLLQRFADGVRKVRGCAERGQRRARLPDEPEMTALPGDPAHERAGGPRPWTCLRG